MYLMEKSGAIQERAGSLNLCIQLEVSYGAITMKLALPVAKLFRKIS